MQIGRRVFEKIRWIGLAALFSAFAHFGIQAQNVITRTNLTGIGTNGVTLSLPVVPQPGITVATTNTNQVVITITNGASFANYELYRRTLLDAAHPWTLNIVGSQGQTNFIADMGVSLSFFEIGVGSDWDQDGIPNSMDGDPTNPNVGVLGITIDSPAQNGLFQ